MIELNKKYDVEINDNDDNGNGITRIDDCVLFVPHTFKNEKLIVEVTELYKRYGVGKIVELLSSSPLRNDSVCPYYNECGGCTFLHSDYEYEKQCKINHIKKLFNIEIDKSYFGKEYNYRNKATFHVSDNSLGYYKEKTHDLVSIDNCVLVDDRINKIIKFISKTNISKMNSITIRTTEEEIMVIIDGEYDYNNFLLNNKIDSLYIGNNCVYGNKYITKEIDSIKYTIYPESFFQINYEGMKELYNIIKSYSGNGNKLLDLYCGTGTIGIFLRDNYKNITGIEISHSSILNANLNKEINSINNINFILGDSKIAKNDVYDTIIVDPPRSGLSKDVIKFLNNSNATIIYVSCNPTTLKRDIELLSNYKLNKLSIVNMFPKTKHIECVTKLIKKSK